MITGQVVNRRPVVSVPFRLPNRPAIAVEFVVDTGFSDFLSLPPAAVVAMGLPYLYDYPASLADGTPVVCPVHGAAVEWDGVLRGIRVLSMGQRPLLGMRMLYGYKFEVEAVEGGAVAITKL